MWTLILIKMRQFRLHTLYPVVRNGYLSSLLPTFGATLHAVVILLTNIWTGWRGEENRHVCLTS